jgi:8-oxo-dGTP pyrophosphatase MutT (NUDIX family)
LRQQVAALPLRRGATGNLEILLVTSRETKRWVIPKGWPQPACSDPGSAAREALEEAGVEGAIEERSVGSFRYAKRRTKADIDVNVTVFILHVTRELDHWPEARERERVWLSPLEASERVAEPDLSALILAVAARSADRSPV